MVETGRRRSSAEDATTHADIIRAVQALDRTVARMAGSVDANFKTLFTRMDRVEGDTDALNERCARIEERLSAGPGAARPKGWMWVPIIAACLAMLGGLSAAYWQAARIAVAVHQAITGGGS